MYKKGQAAMEFLMTYGWAILVVVIAIGMLVYFGVLSPENLMPERCLIATTTGISCMDFNADSSGITLLLGNTLPERIRIDEISIDNCGLIALVTEIEGESSATFFVGCTDPIPKGKLIKGDINIAYTVINTDFQKTATGEIIARV